MRAKFTPGPWRDNSYTADGTLNHACAIWTENGETPIATTKFPICHDKAPTRETAHANARLIAAAPELYQGCIAALAYLADPASTFPDNRAEAARIIRAAVDKATQP